MMAKFFNTASSNSYGQSMVEFALVAPIFFMFLFGVIEGGRLIFTYHEINHAAREGARFAAAQGVHSGNVSTSGPVEAHVRDVTSGIDWDRATIDPVWAGGEGCNEPPNGPGCTIAVQVDYEFQPIVGMIFGSGGINLRSTSSMKIHY